MKRLKLLPVVLVLILAFNGLTFAMTAKEIMDQVDEHQYSKRIRMEAEMIIVKGNRKMTKNLITVGNEESALTRFTNPRDRGTKFLKKDDQLWMFFPNAEDIVKISGHMLEQGMMGSDFSYQDAMETEKLSELYQFSVIREEEYNGRPCYVIEGIKKEGADASYYKRVSWVDKERFALLKEELYARSGRLLKVMTTKKVEKIEGRWYATKMVMEDKLKKNSKTIFNVTSIQFNPEIPEGTFTLENLRN